MKEWNSRRKIALKAAVKKCFFMTHKHSIFIEYLETVPKLFVFWYLFV